MAVPLLRQASAGVSGSGGQAPSRRHYDAGWTARERLNPRVSAIGSSASRFSPFSDCDATARMRKHRPFADGWANGSNRTVADIRTDATTVRCNPINGHSVSRANSCSLLGIRTRAASPRTFVGGLLTGRPPTSLGGLFVLPPPCAPRKRGSAGRVALQPVAIERFSCAILDNSVDPSRTLLLSWILIWRRLITCTRWLSSSLQRVTADH
jgi:hypothetical protein